MVYNFRAIQYVSNKLKCRSNTCLCSLGRLHRYSCYMPQSLTATIAITTASIANNWYSFITQNNKVKNKLKVVCSSIMQLWCNDSCYFRPPTKKLHGQQDPNAVTCRRPYSVNRNNDNPQVEAADKAEAAEQCTESIKNEWWIYNYIIYTETPEVLAYQQQRFVCHRLQEMAACLNAGKLCWKIAELSKLTVLRSLRLSIKWLLLVLNTNRISL